MFVEAEIYASSDSSLALPTNSVVSIENKSYILLKKEGSKNEITFERVEVKPGQINGNYIEILNSRDFKSDDQFLITGAFNLIQE